MTDLPTFGDLHEAIDGIGEIFQKYAVMLTGCGGASNRHERRPRFGCTSARATDRWTQVAIATRIRCRQNRKPMRSRAAVLGAGAV